MVSKNIVVVFLLRLSSSILAVSLDCSILIAPAVFSTIYLFCLSSSCVPYVDSVSGLSLFLAPSVFSNVNLPGSTDPLIYPIILYIVLTSSKLFTVNLAFLKQISIKFIGKLLRYQMHCQNP